MSPKHPLYDLLRSDAYIAVNKSLMFAVGLNEAIIFSELLSRQAYFAEHNQLTDDGYFFNTVDDLYSGTSLSDYHQRMAIANLVKMGLIHTKVQGVPAKRFFQINQDPTNLIFLLSQGKRLAQNARKSTKITSSQKFKELELKKLDTNNNNNNPDPEIDPDIMASLALAVAFHKEAKRQAKAKSLNIENITQEN